MKIRVTEVEASADELRASNTVAEGLMNVLRRCLNGSYMPEISEEEEEE